MSPSPSTLEVSRRAVELSRRSLERELEGAELHLKIVEEPYREAREHRDAIVESLAELDRVLGTPDHRPAEPGAGVRVDAGSTAGGDSGPDLPGPGGQPSAADAEEAQAGDERDPNSGSAPKNWLLVARALYDAPVAGLTRDELFARLWQVTGIEPARRSEMRKTIGKSIRRGLDGVKSPFRFEEDDRGRLRLTVFGRLEVEDAIVHGGGTREAPAASPGGPATPAA